MREVKALKKLNNHPGIMKIKEMSRRQDQLNIVFEFCERNLLQEMRQREQEHKPFTEAEVKAIMHQALSAIAYMHRNGFMHRDIKPENFLIKEQPGQVSANTFEGKLLKLADFGLAKELNEPGPMTEYVSTRWYRAPELLVHSTHYTPAVDIFALGCIMGELLLGRVLFPGNSEGDQITKIVSILGAPPRTEWGDGYRMAEKNGISIPTTIQPTPLGSLLGGKASSDALDLLAGMLKFNPHARLSAP